MFRYGRSTDFTTLLPPKGPNFLEIRADVGSEQAYRDLIAKLHAVDVNTWLDALPDSFVLPSERSAVVDEMLADIPVPPGFDREQLNRGTQPGGPGCPAGSAEIEAGVERVGVEQFGGGGVGACRRRRRPARTSPCRACRPWSSPGWSTTVRRRSARRPGRSRPGRSRATSAPGVPMRTPEVYQAPFGSRGTELRLVTMPESSSADSACRPVIAVRRDVDQHQVVLGAAGDDLRAALHQALGQRDRVVGDVLGVRLEGRTAGLGERDRLGRHHVSERAAEHHRAAAVDRGRELRLAEHHAAARAAQRLVRRGGGDVRVRHRVEVAGEHLAGDQPGEVRHVDDEVWRRPRRRSRASWRS